MFHTTSDHQTIAMTLELRHQTITENLYGRFRLEKIDEKQFLKSLEAQKDRIETFCLLPNQNHLVPTNASKL